MKQYLRIFSMLLLMLIGIGGGDVFGQGSDDFAASFSKADGSYSTRKSTNGWVCANAALVSIDETIAPTINGKTTAKGSITSPALTKGIGTLNFKYANTFSENNGVSITIDIKQNGSTVKTYDMTAKSSVTQGTIYSHTIENINVKGEFTIVITNNCPTNNSKSNKDRVSIWGINWTGYSSSSDPSSDLQLSPSSGEVNMGSTLDISSFKTTAEGYEGTISYTVTSGADVASVDANGVITGLAVGTATIEVKAAAVSGKFAESKQDFTITVKDPNPPVFYESFDTNSGTGANDGDWSSSVATNNATYDNTGWTADNQKGASKCLRLGTGSKLGYATTPAINLSEGDYVLTFRAAAWADDKMAQLQISVAYFCSIGLYFLV